MPNQAKTFHSGDVILFMVKELSDSNQLNTENGPSYSRDKDVWDMPQGQQLPLYTQPCHKSAKKG